MKKNWYQGFVRVTWVLASPGIIIFFLSLLVAGLNIDKQWLFLQENKLFESFADLLDPYLVLSIIGISWFILMWLLFVRIRWIIQGFLAPK